MQLGGDLCILEHIGLVYQKFTADDHGLKLEDVKRIDRQDWASAQRLCATQTMNCLKMLRESKDVHQERTLGTEMYLEMCASYIDIFCSLSFGLRERIVLVAKVSFSFGFGNCGLLMETTQC